MWFAASVQRMVKFGELHVCGIPDEIDVDDVEGSLQRSERREAGHVHRRVDAIDEGERQTQGVQVVVLRDVVFVIVVVCVAHKRMAVGVGVADKWMLVVVGAREERD